ncbi:MAG TPA: hypothetical protein PLP34_05710 [Chitinophagaceae bacterium]|nr:hypothetical protein [Chitinophagaceae bacterium]
MGFNLADKYVALEGSKNQLDILFHLEENEWNGKSRLQLKVLDIRLAENG